MRSSNPTLADNTFSGFGYEDAKTESMTIPGTIYKTTLLLLLVLLSAGWVWMKFHNAGGNTAVVTPWMTGGVIGGLVLAIATVFKKEWAPITAPLYALFEGLFIGGISAMLDATYPGIVMQAAGLTFGTLFTMMAAYSSGLIRATEKFKIGVIAATGGIALVYVASMILGFFGVQIPGIFGNGLIGIGFSLFVVIIAALNFIIDFDFIEQGANRGVPKFMEWYGAFAMMVTLIWLYIEFLRLLSKTRER